MSGTHPTLEMYDSRGFVYMNRRLEVEQNKKGEWKKKFKFPDEWEFKTTSDSKATNFNGYALITGKTSGITAIDIDDPEAEHNKGLMMLLDECCNMVAQTNKGFHYVFKYHPKIKGNQNHELALDTRNDNNCLFCEPTRDVYNPNRELCARYKWIKLPSPEEELGEINDTIISYLGDLWPNYLFSDNYINEPKQQKISFPKVEKKVQEVEEDVDEIKETENSTISSEASEPQDLSNNILVDIVNALPINFVDNRSDWINIGLIFFNENLTLDQFKEVSKRSTRYDEAGCITAWNSFKNDNRGRKITGATLWKLLKENNKTKFYELMEKREDFWKLVELLNHNDTSKYFYNNNPDAYTYNSNLGWFSLGKNNIWKTCGKETPSGLKRHIADTLQLFAKESWSAYCNTYSKKILKVADEESQKKMKVSMAKHLKLFESSYKAFGSNDFCNSVISMLPSLYENEKLEEVMDMNRDVFAFTDGLYDLKTSSFRCIMPQDYVSTTTGYEYPKSNNEDVRKEIMAMLWSIFEDNEVSDYILKVFGTCLSGKNRFEEFYVLTGSGRNGKGVLSDFLKYTFGDYYTTVDNTLITKPLDRKDQPIPALVEARPKRIMMTSEPEGDDKLQIGIIKKISGGDAVEARTLNSKHIYKYVPPYKLLIQANNVPRLSKVEQAAQARQRNILFPHKFVSNPTEPHHRQVDPDLKDKKIKSEAWRNEFMLMLIEKYNEVKDLKSLPAPKAVLASTNEYFDDNNPLKIWLDNHYIITKKNTDTIPALQLKRAYLTDMTIDSISDIKFKELMDFNNITRERKKTGMVYVGLVRKEEEIVDEEV